MILIGLALSATIYPLMQGRKSGWPAWTFIMLGAGALLLGAFMLWERHQPGDPLIQPALLANRTYTNGILVVLAFFGAFSGVLLCVSLFGQLGEGWSPIRAGLTLTAMVIGMIVGMGASFGLVARLGCHLLHVGIALLGAGAIVLALTVTGAHTASTLGLAPGLFLFGAGAGISMGQLFDFVPPASGWTRPAPPPVCSRLSNSSRARPASAPWARSSSQPSPATRRQAHSRSPPGRAWPRSAPCSCSSSDCRCTPASDRSDRPPKSGQRRSQRMAQAPRTEG
jgi:hypothetical protein